MITKRMITFGLIVGVIVVLLCFFYFKDFVSLSYLQKQAHLFSTFVTNHYIESLVLYALVTIIVVMFSLPIVGPITLLGGFLFGTLTTICIAGIAVPLGASISFLCMRYFFSTIMKQRFAENRDIFIQKMKYYGSSYLLTLNLLTIVPFFVISALAAISNVPLWTFVWTSAVGSLPMIGVYAYAGRTFADITSVRDIFSPSLIIAFILLILLSVIPMVLRKRMNTTHRI